jgi:hypothetical protein
MLGLGGNSDRLLGIPGTFSAPSPGGISKGRCVDPVW